MLTLDRCEELIEKAIASTTRGGFQMATSLLLNEYKILSFGIGRSSTHWRARIIENNRFDLLKEIDYPPANVITRAGRLNDAGEPYFYVSSNAETAIAEVLPREGQLVQVAGFRIVQDEILRLICLGEYQSVSKRGYTLFNGTDPGGTIRKLVHQMSFEEQQMCLLIDSFLAHVISDRDARNSDYLRSRVLRDLLYDHVDADGITFPSARDPGGVNFGVKPGPSDRLYRNVCCIVVRIGRKRRFAPFEMELVSTATGLTKDRKGFIWANEAKPKNFVMYNITKSEYEAQHSADF